VTLRLIAENAGTEYSSIQSFNCDCSRFLLLRPSKLGGAFDHFALFGADGEFLGDLPIGASDRPRWDATQPNRIYYLFEKQLRFYNTEDEQITLLREFEEFDSIDNKGEADISSDGNHLVLCWQRKDAEGKMQDVEAFVYSISQDRRGPTLDVSRGIESLYITSDNEVIVSWASGGMELFDRDMRLSKSLAPVNGHKAVTQDADGTACMVWSTSADPAAEQRCPNGIEKVNLRTFERTCLLPLPYSQWGEAVHISPASGWVLVECYESSDVSDNPYKGKLVKVPLDGSAVTILGDHGSIIQKDWEQDWKYLSMPKATVRRDGRAVLYGSNRANPVPGRCDAYLLQLPQEAQGIPSPPGGSRTFGRP